MAEKQQEETQELTPYIPKTEEELRQLAIDIQAGRIFTSQHCKNPMDLRLVFMAAALSGPDYFEWLKENEIAIFYEEMAKAGPRSVNGMPMFLSHNHLTTGEWATVLEKINRIEEALKEI